MLFGQRVEIGDAAHHLAIKQLLHYSLSHAFDVHHSAAPKVKQAFAQLGGAVGIHAAVVYLALGADNFAVALRTMSRKFEDRLSPRMLDVVDDLNDFRNHVTTALHLHPVADLETKACDEVRIVQSGAAHGSTADEDRRQLGHRRELACAAHLDGYGVYLRDSCLCCELVSNGPARRAARVAEPLLRRMRIHLQHHTVDLVAERSAFGFGAVDELHHLFHRVHALAIRVHAKSQGG